MFNEPVQVPGDDQLSVVCVVSTARAGGAQRLPLLTVVRRTQGLTPHVPVQFDMCTIHTSCFKVMPPPHVRVPGSAVRQRAEFVARVIGMPCDPELIVVTGLGFSGWRATRAVILFSRRTIEDVADGPDRGTSAASISA